VYWEQYSKDKKYYEALEQYCYKDIDSQVLEALRNVKHVKSGNYCREIFEDVRTTSRPPVALKSLADQAKLTGLFKNSEDDHAYTFYRLSEGYQAFENQVPTLLTKDLSYDPRKPDLWKMFSATFSHGDLWHLLGNLLFFYIFAAAVELVIGHTVFTAFILLTSIVTNLAYTYATLNLPGAMPTVGLSGVVMSMVAALALMLPHAKISFFFWFVIIVRVFHFPALYIAVWYIGWDIYDIQRFGATSGINYVAHISGAIMGAVLALYYVIFEKKRVRAANRHYW